MWPAVQTRYGSGYFNDDARFFGRDPTERLFGLLLRLLTPLSGRDEIPQEVVVPLFSRSIYLSSSIYRLLLLRYFTAGQMAPFVWVLTLITNYNLLELESRDELKSKVW